jgi:hypothetical protein
MKKQRATITFEAVEFPTARQAIQHRQADDRVAIYLNGRHLVVSQEDADRLAAAGVSFAYLCERDGHDQPAPVN